MTDLSHTNSDYRLKGSLAASSRLRTKLSSKVSYIFASMLRRQAGWLGLPTPSKSYSYRDS